MCHNFCSESFGGLRASHMRRVYAGRISVVERQDLNISAGSAIGESEAMACRRFSILLLLLVAGVLMFGSEHARADKKMVATARKEDIPFIKCSVCEAIAKQLARQVKEKREKSATKKVYLYTDSLEALLI